MSPSDASDGTVSRREFFGTATLTTAGLATAAAGISAYFAKPEAPDLSLFLRPENQVRLGFIGVGNRGDSLLQTALQVPGARPIAVADVQDSKRGGALETIEKVVKNRGWKTGKPRGYRDYRELLEDEDVEGVVIATPHYLHGPMAMDAIEAGKHVYCEKAMAFTIGENQDLYRRITGGAKAGDGRLVFQVGHQRHYSPLYERVVEMIQSDQIGDVAAVRAQWNLNEDSRRPCPDPELEKVVNWRFYSELSGGLTTEYATHQIDVANWVFGTHPDSVCGFGGVDWFDDGRDTHDNIHLILNYRVPVLERDPYGRLRRSAEGKPVQARDSEGRLRYRNVRFQYTSIMENEHLRASEMVLGRYGTIEVSLGGGEFFKEKKARQDPQRIAEGTNPTRALQKRILRTGATVDPTTASLARARGEPIPGGVDHPGHWTRFIEPIKGAYDQVETLLAVEGFVKCIRLSRQGKPFDHELKASVEVGMWSAVPALMANIAMREERTVSWSEFFPEPA